MYVQIPTCVCTRVALSTPYAMGCVGENVHMSRDYVFSKRKIKGLFAIKKKKSPIYRIYGGAVKCIEIGMTQIIIKVQLSIFHYKTVKIKNIQI